MTQAPLMLGVQEAVGSEVLDEELEPVDGEVLEPATELVIAAAAVDPLAARNLFGEADRIAARAASAGTRRQYGAIYRTFAFWLTE